MPINFDEINFDDIAIEHHLPSTKLLLIFINYFFESKPEAADLISIHVRDFYNSKGEKDFALFGQSSTERLLEDLYGEGVLLKHTNRRGKNHIITFKMTKEAKTWWSTKGSQLIESSSYSDES